jgi:hypothetical protein
MTYVRSVTYVSGPYTRRSLAEGAGFQPRYVARGQVSSAAQPLFLQANTQKCRKFF